ncbi:MAG: A24 family peptidase [Pseudomonadota bacterium]
MTWTALLAICLTVGIYAIFPLLQKVAMGLVARSNADWRESSIEWAMVSGGKDNLVSKLEKLNTADPPSMDPVTKVLRLLWPMAILAFVVLKQDPFLAAAVAVMSCLLIIASIVDLNIRLLPDTLVFAAGGLGLAVCLAGLSLPPDQAIIGLLAGAMPLWLIGLGYKALRGLDGLGLGDVKLGGVAGIWVGWQTLPIVIFAAAVLGACYVLYTRRLAIESKTSLPFGPSLALGLIIGLGVNSF